MAQVSLAELLKTYPPHIISKAVEHAAAVTEIKNSNRIHSRKISNEDRIGMNRSDYISEFKEFLRIYKEKGEDL